MAAPCSDGPLQGRCLFGATRYAIAARS